ncbi:MAG: hypothetical protein RR314_04915 [Oscillospiraceae bacterium]
MDLLQQEVTHKAFGKGRVTAFDETYITVRFETGEKRFIFPDAFQGFLSATEPKIAAQIQDNLNLAAAEKQQVQQEKLQEQELRLRLQQQELKIAKARAVRARKVTPRANIAFKCNFCDGGKSDTRVGFFGVCSDKMIRNNIVSEHRAWCSLESSPCMKYHKGEMTRQELDDLSAGGGFVCYESQMLRDWKALAGVVCHGENAGRRMKLAQVQRNSLCVLTTRDPKTSEPERYVFAVFLVDEAHEGDGQEEGYVGTDSEFKITLSPAEARGLRFWDYYANENNPQKAFWGAGLFRYFGDIQAAQLLREIARIKVGTPNGSLAERFYRHFCKINNVDADSLGEANGAIKIAKA